MHAFPSMRVSYREELSAKDSDKKNATASIDKLTQLLATESDVEIFKEGNDNNDNGALNSCHHVGICTAITGQ